MSKKLVYICSPCRGDYEKNIREARGYCQVVIKNYPDVIPIAPHIYFTQFLDDTNPTERSLGMEAGLALLDMCDEIWVYGLNNPSKGMQAEIDYALKNGIKIRDGFGHNITTHPHAESCVCCDEIIPEGRQVCPTCETKWGARE